MLPRAGLPRAARRRPRAILHLALVCGGLLLALLWGSSLIPLSGPSRSSATSPFPLPADQNSSGNPYGLCPSGGPVFLGVDWNCVAVLNLTMVLLLLGGTGIVAYVFWRSDAAELPGDSAEIPLTEEEWEEARARRKAVLAEDSSTPPAEGRNS